MFYMSKIGLWDAWNKLTPQLMSIFITTIIICIFCIVYNAKIKNYNQDKQLTGFLVLTEMFITKVEGIVISVMGKAHRKITPYIMYLFMYIIISSIVGVVGIEPLTTSYTVTFSMGLVTFLGIYYYGLRYQRLAFFKKYFNPIELIGQFVPLISLSFRLFGNILGGSILMGLLYGTLIKLQGNLFWSSGPGMDWDNKLNYWWAGFNIFTTISLPWLHLYFDLFDGVIQSVVFSMLTLSYWSEAKHSKGNNEEKEITKRQV